MRAYCPSCHTGLMNDAAFCDNCGTAVSTLSSAPAGPSTASPSSSDGDPVCPGCSQPVYPEDAFCGSCGHAVNQMPPDPRPGDVPSSTQQPPLPPADILCSQCGNKMPSHSAFCDNCGTAVSASSPPAQYAPPQSTYQPPAQPSLHAPPPAIGMTVVAPRFIVQTYNATLNIPTNKSELIIGRKDAASDHFPDVDLAPYGGEEGGVSRTHAKFIIQGNQCYLEDLQAVNYTFINQQKLSPGEQRPLNNGDELRLGKVILVFFSQ